MRLNLGVLPTRMNEQVANGWITQYDPAPTSRRVTQLMATRSGKTTSRRITSSKPERYVSSNLLTRQYNLAGTLMEMFEPSESRRLKSDELEKDVTRLLGGSSGYGQVNRGDADTDSRRSRQPDQGATAITIPGSKPANNTQRPKQSVRPEHLKRCHYMLTRSFRATVGSQAGAITCTRAVLFPSPTIALSAYRRANYRTQSLRPELYRHVLQQAQTSLNPNSAGTTTSTALQRRSGEQRLQDNHPLK